MRIKDIEKAIEEGRELRSKFGDRVRPLAVRQPRRVHDPDTFYGRTAEDGIRFRWIDHSTRHNNEGVEHQSFFVHPAVWEAEQQNAREARERRESLVNGYRESAEVINAMTGEKYGATTAYSHDFRDRAPRGVQITGSQARTFVRLLEEESDRREHEAAS